MNFLGNLKLGLFIYLRLGVVQGWAAIIMGMMSGSIPWYTMMVLHKESKLLKQVDDTLAVFHTHAVAGSLGGILAGFFADPKLCYLFYGVEDSLHYTGLVYGIFNGRPNAGFRQMMVQLLGIVFVILLNVTTTSIVCLLVRIIVPLRLSEDDLQVGDEAVHGEVAYALWGDGEKLETAAGEALTSEKNHELPTVELIKSLSDAPLID